MARQLGIPRWALALAAISIEACSLLDWDELTRRTESAPGDAGDAAPADAGADRTTDDAAVELPRDAGDEGLASRYCESRLDASACLDFDDGDLVPPPWATTFSDAGERLVLSPSAASAPNAATFEVPALDAGACYARLWVNLPLRTAVGAELEAHVSIDEIPPNGSVALVYFSAESGKKEALVTVGGPSLYLSVTDPTTDAGKLTSTVARPSGPFVLRLRTSFRGAKKTTLTLNEIEVATVFGGLTNITGGYDVGVSADSSNANGTTRVRYDNVVVRALSQ